MIIELTVEQESKVSEYRDWYFSQAICTDRADRVKAEEAVRRLYELGGLEVKTIEWVSSPDVGKSRYDTLMDTLMDTLRDTLRDTLSDTLWDTLSDTIRESLWDTLWDTLVDTGWVCYYTYCRDVLGIEYEDKSSKMLDVYNELLASCFGMWVIPDGTVILCERPSEAKVEDEELVDLEWGEK